MAKAALRLTTAVDLSPLQLCHIASKIRYRVGVRDWKESISITRTEVSHAYHTRFLQPKA